MAEEFAFESGKTSIAFGLRYGLGDSVIAKKVFDALIELAPDCRVDIFYARENHKIFAKAFYGHSKNLNRVLNYHEHYEANMRNYDLAILVFGGRANLLQHANIERLQANSPALFEAVVKLDAYNKKNYFEIGSPNAVSLRNAIMSRILGKNCFYILSADGALPIRDEKVNIALKPKYRREFDALNLGRYITIYTDIYVTDKDNPKVKCWPLRYWHEYVASLKRHFPQFEIIQCGGMILKSKTSTATSSAVTWN